METPIDIWDFLDKLNNSLGFAIGAVGLWLTILAMQAAEDAAEAARSARVEVERSNALISLSAISANLEEIKAMQRNGRWGELPAKYSSVRGALIEVRTSGILNHADHQTKLQGAILQFRQIEKEVEKAVQKGQTLNVAKFNDLVSSQQDELSEVLGILRRHSI